MSTTHFAPPSQRSWTQIFFQTFISAHSSIQSLPERRKAELIAALSLSFSIIITGGLAVTLHLTGFNVLVAVGFLFGAISFISYLISRSAFYRRAPLLFVGGFALLAYTASMTSADPALFLTISFAVLFLLSNLLDFKWMTWFIIINLVVAFLVTVFFTPQIQGVSVLNARAGLFTIGLFVLLFAWHRDSVEQLRLTEILKTQTNLEKSNLELQNAQDEVNTRFAELQLAAEVGRTVSQVRTLDVMLTDAAELIRKQFDLYYVQVYLTNPSQTALILQSGTGAVGAQLLERAHQLPLNTASINGRAAIEKRSIVVADTSASATFKPNPLLPNTRSEMAVPLMLGERVVGVLDMQSEHANALNPEILSAFEALAGQLAIAIQNANFLAETQAARAEIESKARRQSRANWVDYMDAIHKPEETGFVFEQNKITPISGQEVATSENAMTAPIAVTGEALGNLVVEMEGGSPIARTSELVNIVARQVAQQIESLRLLDSAERYRFEAEEASRRLTQEGWQDYFRQSQNQNQTLGYFYDRTQVRPAQPEAQTDASALTLPIRVRDENVGRISVLDAGDLDAGALEMAQAITQRLGDHIESLRLLEETQRGQVELNKRAQQLAAVSEISAVSSRELDIEKMLAMVVHLTQRKFGLYHAHVFTFNEASQQLEIVACGWQEGDEREGTHGTASIAIGQEQSLVARAARTRQPVVVNNVRADAGWLPNPQLPDTAAELAVPLVIGDQVLGVLDVQSERVDAFSGEDISIQITLAAQVATALQNARSFSRAQRQAEREAMLNAINQKIQSATSVEAVLQIAARELGHALGAPRTIAQLSLKDTQSSGHG